MALHGPTASAAELALIDDRIRKWSIYRSFNYCRLRSDLYQVRNAGWNGNPPLSHWPPGLVDPDDEINAAVEHYFLCRCWVGTGAQPAWQMRKMSQVYNFGKAIGLTPRHNPNNPPTPNSGIQSHYQERGIRGRRSRRAGSGRSAPWVSRPPTY